MKKNLTRFFLTAVILLCVPLAFQSSARAENDKEYKITVIGGHAEDADGKVITSAKPGTSFQVVADDGNGKYWTKWESDIPIEDNTFIFWCTMPEHDVKFTSKTVATQRTFVIDLTDPYTSFSQEDAALLRNALIAYAGKTAAFGDYDFDGNGEIDVTFDYRDGQNVFVSRILDMKSHYDTGLRYSLGTSYDVIIPHGEVGRLRIVIDNAKSRYPVLDYTSKKYSIKVNGGTCNLTEAIPGRIVKATVTYAQRDYLKEVSVVGVTDYNNVFPSYYKLSDGVQFFMPPRDVEVTFVMAPQEPLDITFDGNFEWKADDISEVEKAIEQASGKYTCVRNGKYGFDFDDDFTLDIEIDSKAGKVIVYHTAYTEKVSERRYQEYVTDDRARYWPVTISYENLPEPTPTPAPKPRNTEAPTATPEANPTVTPTQKPTATPTQVATATPDTDESRDNSGTGKWMGKLLLLTVCLALTGAFFVIGFRRYKRNKRKKPKNPYGDWNEDRVIISSSSGATTHKRKTMDEPDDPWDGNNK
ncbi:MAG: PT domain-containing protein [Lachnospiraceae bacterium]|nr:PT domain-containing protein [Lachnospiraceae bacterium]